MIGFFDTDENEMIGFFDIDENEYYFLFILFVG